MVDDVDKNHQISNLVRQTVTQLFTEKVSLFDIETKKGSIISVVGKTTVEFIELFKCTQKVP